MESNAGFFTKLADLLLTFGDLETLASEVRAFDGVEADDQPATISDFFDALETERSYW